MSSGVAVADEVKHAFADMKMNKNTQYMILGMNDANSQIVIKKRADRGAPYSEFLSDMKEVEECGDCRYCIYDMEIVAKSGQINDKLVLICWNPDCSKIKNKMIYASSTDTLKHELGTGIAAHIQASDMDDLIEADVKKKIMSK